MMMGNHRMSCTFTMQQIGGWVVRHSKVDYNLRILPCRVLDVGSVIALLSLGNNVFVDSLYEPALEPSIHTLGS